MTTSPKLTKLVGFYADAEMQEIVYRRAAELTEGNASAYLRRLAVADITAASERPSGVQADIFERLAMLYRPRIAGPLGAVLRRQAVDQPAFLERLLLELADALALVPAADVHVSHVPRSALAPGAVSPSPVAPAGLARSIADIKKQLAVDVSAARARSRQPRE